jgi:hypothetical protein
MRCPSAVDDEQQAVIEQSAEPEAIEQNRAS